MQIMNVLFFIVKTFLSKMKNRRPGVAPSVASHLNRMCVMRSSPRGYGSFGRSPPSPHNEHSVHLQAVNPEMLSEGEQNTHYCSASRARR